MDSISKKTVLITGASRGIGKAIAILFAKNNYTVYGTSTTEEGANNISKFLKDYGGYGITLDVTKYDTYKEVINSIKSPISVLINNAGITRDKILFRMSDDDWDAVINTNLKSIFKLTKFVAIEMMKQKYGRIINISSVSAFRSQVGHSNYMASKAGLIGLTHGLASELGRYNITVNCIAPGLIETDMTKNLPNNEEDIKKLPIQRIGQPEDVANAALFLASENSGYITGTTIHVNGGMFMN
jgi:3-oxoacyl-[acyl-carrier protein] reductase